ncbi:MAG: zinc ribbon domain-containing protein [Omnitrophica WOR_2 bacterium]
MDLGSFFLILALLTLVILFISRPFFASRKTALKALAGPREQKISLLLAHRDQIINALKELDFDYQLGKIPEENYPDQRAALLNQGAEILRELDSYQAGGTGQAQAESAEARLEQAIAARQAALTPAYNGISTGGNGNGKDAADDDLEVLIASRRRSRKEKSGGFCPQCGGPVQQSDRFCPKCGSDLRA